MSHKPSPPVGTICSIVGIVFILFHLYYKPPFTALFSTGFMVGVPLATIANWLYTETANPLARLDPGLAGIRIAVYGYLIYHYGGFILDKTSSAAYVNQCWAVCVVATTLGLLDFVTMQRHKNS